jgi:hypothetical protein
LSRHRKIKFSRSKAILVAAGALSVATAASATAVTWLPGASAGPAHAGHAGHAVGQDASSGPRLTVTDQLAQPSAGVAYQLTGVTLAQRTYQIRSAESRDAVAQWSAARQRAAAQAAATAAASTAPTATASLAPSASPRQIAAKMLGSFGWSASQFGCLDPLWAHESGWSVTAENPSGAYGIPQALPGSKMASAGPDWQASAATQITWGLKYIKNLYGSPCAAWDHEQATGWY